METKTVTFDDLKNKMEDFRKKMVEEGSKIFKEMTKELFDKYSELNSFSFSQYTPYFNDGEECTFSVNEVCVINGHDEYDDDEDNDGGENVWKKEEGGDERAKNLIKDVRKFLSSAPEDIMKETFGDHSIITIYRDKDALVEEYEHD